MSLLLENEEREALWRQLTATIEEYIERVEELAVAPPPNVDEIRLRLARYDFEKPTAPSEALDFAADNLYEFQVHTPHPRYFGLFNPAPAAMSIAADALVAAFNPQIAAWSHSPFAAEVERHLIKAFGARFGYKSEETDGTFCSGGAEANHTALLTALVSAFPSYAEEGLRALGKQPVFYVSTQSHHSFVKAARFCGLGTNAVRAIETDEKFRMSVSELARQIERDREENFAPFMIVATAGTTNAGIIDDLPEIAQLAESEKLWLHVDAAWGGGAVFSPRLRSFLSGVERADSITFDAHKWFSVPMGAGIYLTRHAQILEETCRITTSYMPRDATEHGVTDPFAHSMQWSRRFIGLKVFLPLLVAGWRGYAETIERQTAMGDYLREQLIADGWRIINETPLPTVAFAPAETATLAELDAISRAVVASGEAWISITSLAPEVPVLRACITNFRTGEEEVRRLVAALNEARESQKSENNRAAER